MNREKVFYILTTLTIIFTILGGTLAYFRWQTTSGQSTSVSFTVGSTFSCSADGGGDITNNVYFVPTDCTNSTYAIKREITTHITNSASDDVYLNMWLNINSIGSGLSNSNNFKWALTTDSTSCTSNVVSSGNFYGKQANDKINLLEDETTEDTYYLYIWLDKEETSTSTMNQSVSLSLGGECSNQEPNKVYFNLFNRTYDSELDEYHKEDRIGLFRNKIRSVNIVNEINVPTGAISFNLGDIDFSNEDDVVGWLENEDNGIYDFKIAPKSGSKLYSKNLASAFWNMFNLTDINLSGLNTSETIDMYSMFSAETYSDTWSNLSNITLGDKFSTQNVTNMAYMFANLKLNSLDLNNKFNTSNVTNMASMFYNFSLNSYQLYIDYDTSKVTNMNYMFYSAANRANNFTITLGNKFNFSNVEDSNLLFSRLGSYSNNFSLKFDNDFTISNLRSMNRMFLQTGAYSTNFILELNDKFDVSNVMDLSNTFFRLGYYSNNFTLNFGNGFNLSNPETEILDIFLETGMYSNNMKIDFGNNFSLIKDLKFGSITKTIGNSATNFHVLIGDTFFPKNKTDFSYEFSSFGKYVKDLYVTLNSNLSNATNMYGMFDNAGSNTRSFSLNFGNNFAASKVTNMAKMFSYAGMNATNYSLNLGSNFNTSNVTDMSSMFSGIGMGASNFSLNLGNQFNTSKVVSMSLMFSGVGKKSTDFSLNLGNSFNTHNVTNMRGMFSGFGENIINFTLNLGNQFNTSNVKDMSSMFSYVGFNASNFDLNLGNNFNTSNVTDMYAMFSRTGYNVTNFNLNFGNQFDTSNVTNMCSMFSMAANKATTPFTLDLSAGNFSNVTGNTSMFENFGNNMATIYVKDSTAQNFIIRQNSNFSASNVLIK